VREVNTLRVTRELNIFLMSECGLETDCNRELERACGSLEASSTTLCALYYKQKCACGCPPSNVECDLAVKLHIGVTSVEKVSCV
jgi:hypothetical protein